MIWKELTSPVAGYEANLARIKSIDEDQKIVVADGLYEGEIPEDEESEFPLNVGGFGLYWWYEGKKKNIPFADLTEEEIASFYPEPEEDE